MNERAERSASSFVLASMTGMSVKLTAFAFRNLLRAILPFFAFVAATVVLIMVDAYLSMLLIPVIVLYLIPLYLVNRGVARQQKAYTPAASAVRGIINQGLNVAIETDTTAEEKLRCIREGAGAPEHDIAANLFWKRKLSDARVQWVNTSFFVMCLLGLFIFFGITTRTGDRTWTEFLI